MLSSLPVYSFNLHILILFGKFFARGMTSLTNCYKCLKLSPQKALNLQVKYPPNFKKRNTKHQFLSTL